MEFVLVSWMHVNYSNYSVSEVSPVIHRVQSNADHLNAMFYSYRRCWKGQDIAKEEISINSELTINRAAIDSTLIL